MVRYLQGAAPAAPLHSQLCISHTNPYPMGKSCVISADRDPWESVRAPHLAPGTSTHTRLDLSSQADQGNGHGGGNGPYVKFEAPTQQQQLQQRAECQEQCAERSSPPLHPQHILHPVIAQHKGLSLFIYMSLPAETFTSRRGADNRTWAVIPSLHIQTVFIGGL